jgi:hypothetical protein
MNQQTPRGTPWETYCRSVVSARGLDMNIMHRVMADELVGVSHVSPVSSHPAPKDVLKKQKENGKKRAVEGPTIDVLVENSSRCFYLDVYASSTKRETAASNNAALSNEIRSSGGIHSFLTMFRTRGTTRELRVVACMAIAYTLLPSFVASSQTTHTIARHQDF